MTYAPTHPTQRAFERYGIVLTWVDLHRLEDQVRDKRSVRVANNGHSERHLVKHGETVLVAVVRDGKIMTFLAPETLLSGASRDWNRLKSRETG